jgi:hypothetical protein
MMTHLTVESLLRDVLLVREDTNNVLFSPSEWVEIDVTSHALATVLRTRDACGFHINRTINSFLMPFAFWFVIPYIGWTSCPNVHHFEAIETLEHVR